MRQNYMVAMCDILGFTVLVQNSPLNHVVETSLGWFSKALHHSMHKGEFPEQTPSLEELQSHTHLGLAWFSDTILMYTLEDTNECIQALTSTLGWLLFETMLDPETRLRCGVSYGEAHIDAHNSIYIGQPLIEAYQLEDSQAWSGGALTAAAVHRLPEEARSGKFVDWFVTPYQVPLKKGKTVQTLAIDWTIGSHPGGFQLHWSDRSEEPTSKEWEEQRQVCEKWRNTRSFHDSVCRFCRP